MYFSLKFVVLAVIVTACYLCAEKRVQARQLKSEGGLLISFDPVSNDISKNQVDIFDMNARAVASLNVLGPLHEAGRVSIYDVSARENIVAVAAVYKSKEENPQVPTAASLLLFDFSGQLLSAIGLAPSHAIARLAVDDKSNVWTLTSGAGSEADPATVPMIVEYTREGKIAAELLTRNMFPFHASDLQENIYIGAAAMGYDAGVVWFWLPGSTDFVTISTRDNKISMAKTEWPQKEGRNSELLRIMREPSGNLVAQVGEDGEQGGRVVTYYAWSPSTSWVQFKPGKCDGGSLIGVSNQGQIYRFYHAEHAMCTFRNTN